MIVKCINGDLLNVQTISEIASHFNVHVSQVHLVDASDDDTIIPITHYVIISDRNIILSPFIPIPIPLVRLEWLMECTNESILDQLVSQLSEIPPLFGNPLLEHHILDIIEHSDISPTCIKYMSANPSDLVLDLLFTKYEENISTQFMSQNSNPRASQYLISMHHHNNQTLIDWFRLFKNEKDFVWNHFESREILPPHPDALELREISFGNDPFTLLRWGMCLHNTDLLKRWIECMEAGEASFCDQIAIENLDVVVDWLIDVVRVNRPKDWSRCTQWLCTNPHPRAVSYLLTHTEEIQYYVVSNPHPEMVEYAISHYLQNITNVQQFFYRVKLNPNPDVMIHCLDMFRNTNHVLNESEINSVYRYFSKRTEFRITYEN